MRPLWWKVQRRQFIPLFLKYEIFWKRNTCLMIPEWPENLVPFEQFQIGNPLDDLKGRAAPWGHYGWKIIAWKVCSGKGHSNCKKAARMILYSWVPCSWIAAKKGKRMILVRYKNIEFGVDKNNKWVLFNRWVHKLIFHTLIGNRGFLTNKRSASEKNLKTSDSMNNCKNAAHGKRLNE